MVKWKGYPDSDNMWVDKDDIFVDDKVQSFKESNPDARVHLRVTRSELKPHSPLASSRSSSSSYFAPHIQSMSSNESNPEHSPLIGSVAPRQPYVPHSNPIESAKIADAFRQLTLHSPTQLGREQAATVFEVSVTIHPSASRPSDHPLLSCYVTVGMFTRRGLGSAKQ